MNKEKDLIVRLYEYIEFVYPNNNGDGEPFNVDIIRNSDKGSSFTVDMFITFFSKYELRTVLSQRLAERNAIIMFDRYVTGMTLSQVGERYGVSKERVRQITSKCHEIICGEYCNYNKRKL